MTTPLTPQEISEQIAPLFSRHNPNGIYLANHSLGRPLSATQSKLNDYLEAWYKNLNAYHNKGNSLTQDERMG